MTTHPKSRIGIDFDNTIVCYDAVFHKVAVERNLIPETLAASKSAVRDFLRSIKKEDKWTELQGIVYGPKIHLAKPYVGVDSFFNLCSKKQIPTFIISHKTQFPFLGPKYDLHQSAKRWVYEQQFTSIPPIFFELTLQEKLERIRLQECSVFIDDLPEVLTEKIFPSNVQKILFDPHRIHPQSKDYFYATSWEEISKMVDNLYVN